MAIVCETPETLEKDVQTVYDIVNTDGVQFLNTFKENIELLKTNWTGDDADTNISDLVRIFNGVKDDLKIVMNNIVATNNGPVKALITDFIADGGTATQPSDIYVINLGEDLYHVKTKTKYEVKDGFISAAETFEKIPGSFQTFVDKFEIATDNLFKNWTSGAGCAEVCEQFNKIKTYFNDSCYSTLEKVKTNIVTIKTNKQNLINQ